MKIVFVGFMGAGKSSVAAATAQQLQLPCLEMDDEVARVSGFPSVAELIRARGETEFREIESRVLEEFLKIPGIVSTGGGVIERANNRALLARSNSTIIYLSATFNTIENRIKGSAVDAEGPNSANRSSLVTRPLFADRGAALTRYTKRLPLYEDITPHKVATDSRSLSEITSDVLEIIAEVQGSGADPAALKSPPSHPRLCLILGHPVRHSMSPTMHRAGYTAAGIGDKYCYSSVDIPPANLVKAVESIRLLGIRGISVTIPHKSTIIPLLDEIHPTAKTIGSVNTVVNNNGTLVGFNTDWLGLVTPLERLLPLEGKQVCVIGTGGAARAAAFGLKERGAIVHIAGRNSHAAGKLAQEIGATSGSLEDYQSIAANKVIIQATSVGMSPDITSTPLPNFPFHRDHIVFDMVYSPRRTRFLQEALAEGAKTIGGLEMLLEQGCAQFELFTGYEAPRDEMRETLV